MAAPDPTCLLGVVRRFLPQASAIADLRQLSGGAVQETWAFLAGAPQAPAQLVLRRARGELRATRSYGVNLAEEARAMLAAEAGGVPVAHVQAVLRAEDALGDGFIMDFRAGDTIPRRILRDAAFTAIRPLLATQCGAVLARLHGISPAALDFLELRTPASTIARLRAQYDELDRPSPIMALAFRRLAETLPAPWPSPVPVHGDFRNGNLLVTPDGIAAVLDWENVHLGDPHEDLAYLCVPSWRFGVLDKPVGGFGSEADLLAGYAAAGGAPLQAARLRFWLLAFTLEWGLTCALFARQFTSGMDPGVERGAIGRRRSEAELDLLLQLEGEDAG